MSSLVGHGLLISGIRCYVDSSFKDEAEKGKEILLGLGGKCLHLNYSKGIIDGMHFTNPINYDITSPTIIYFVGMGEVYERLGISEYASECIVYQYLQLGCNVLLWNYPHVHNSSGSPSLINLIECCNKLLNYLFENNVKEEDIILHGHSMGGAISTYFATLRDENNKLLHPKLNVCNDRSFCDIKSVIEKHIETKIPLFGKSIGHLCGNIVYEYSKWDLNTLNNWNPRDSEGYYWCIHHKNDELIPEETSLAYHLRKELRDTNQIIDLDPCNSCIIGIDIIYYNNIYSNPCHERPLLPKEWERHINHIIKAIPKIKDLKNK